MRIMPCGKRGEAVEMAIVYQISGGGTRAQVFGVASFQGVFQRNNL